MKLTYVLIVFASCFVSSFAIVNEVQLIDVTEEARVRLRAYKGISSIYELLVHGLVNLVEQSWDNYSSQNYSIPSYAFIPNFPLSATLKLTTGTFKKGKESKLKALDATSTVICAIKQ